MGHFFIINQVELPKTQPDGRPQPYGSVFDVKLGYRRTQILSNTEHNIIINQDIVMMKICDGLPLYDGFTDDRLIMIMC